MGWRLERSKAPLRAGFFIGLTMKITDIIEYENENTALDFKRDQYKKENYFNLLKDIISLANAETANEKLIITGLKHKPSGERDFAGIPDSEIIDEATYQNIIRDNIEPDIEISYTYTKHRGQTFGVLKILNSSEKPYMMKKDYQPLKRGDCFIRKGSNQQKAIRADFEKIYAQREKLPFTGKVKIFFSGTPQSSEIELYPAKEFLLPSERAEQEILKIIQEKETAEAITISSFNRPLFPQALLKNFTLQNSYLGGIPYPQRSIETLKENLKNLKETYQDDDLYEAIEIHSERINIDITNNANEYITDAKIHVEIEPKDAIIIAEKIPKNPEHSIFKIPHSSYHDPYPEILNTNGITIIFEHMGDLKHKLKTQAFNADLRVFIAPTTEEKNVIFKVKIFAKNLPDPISQDLKIKIRPRPQAEAEAQLRTGHD